MTPDKNQFYIHRKICSPHHYPLLHEIWVDAFMYPNLKALKFCLNQRLYIQHKYSHLYNATQNWYLSVH